MMKIMMGDDNKKHNSNEVCELYEAAVDGCVATLKSLIQNDPLILSKICLSTQLTESPLHVSASLGHVEFTKELLRLKPKLASELDSLKRSPLHFAAAEGHAEIAVALLREDKVCLVKDQDGKIPLHHAAVRGHVHLIKLLISSSGLGHDQESLFTPLPSGETILHLCVKHNHLDALKKVVHLAGCSENTDFLNAKDHESGNTILHLAVMLNQAETVDYLISLGGVEKGTLNRKNERASDLVNRLPMTENRKKIEKAMGITKSKRFTYRWILERLDDYKGEWLKEMRGSIMVVATVIATMTFQTATNPPGGVWQETSNSHVAFDGYVYFDCDVNICIAGTSVLAHAWESHYLQFIRYNSSAFIASLSVILLLIGGLPLKSKTCVWLLTMAMCATFTFMALTFLKGMYIVTPYHIAHTINRIYDTSFKMWIGLLAIIGVVHTIIFLISLFIYHTNYETSNNIKLRKTASVHHDTTSSGRNDDNDSVALVMA